MLAEESYKTHPQNEPGELIFTRKTSTAETIAKTAVTQSITPARPSWHLSYEDKVPYNVSLINLEEGPRLLSNVIECEPGQVKTDMPVEVVYEDNEDYTLPKFRPVKK